MPNYNVVLEGDEGKLLTTSVECDSKYAASKKATTGLKEKGFFVTDVKMVTEPSVEYVNTNTIVDIVNGG